MARWALPTILVAMTLVAGCSEEAASPAICGDGVVTPPEQCDPDEVRLPGSCPENCFYMGAPPERSCVERCESNQLHYCGGDNRERQIVQDCDRSDAFCARQGFGPEIFCLDFCAPGSPPRYCEGSSLIHCEMNQEGLLVRTVVPCQEEGKTCVEDEERCTAFCATEREPGSACEEGTAVVVTDDGRESRLDCEALGLPCRDGKCIATEDQCVDFAFGTAALRVSRDAMFGVSLHSCTWWAQRCEMRDGRATCVGCPPGYVTTCTEYGETCTCGPDGTYRCSSCTPVGVGDRCDFAAGARMPRPAALQLPMASSTSSLQVLEGGLAPGPLSEAGIKEPASVLPSATRPDVDAGEVQ